MTGARLERQRGVGGEVPTVREGWQLLRVVVKTLAFTE